MLDKMQETADRAIALGPIGNSWSAEWCELARANKAKARAGVARLARIVAVIRGAGVTTVRTIGAA